MIRMAEYCDVCSKKLKNRDDKYKHGHHRGYCRTCLRQEVIRLVDSFEDKISKNLKKISHKLTSEELQIIEMMVQIDNEEKKLKSLKDKRRIFTQVLSLDEKELEDYRIDINNIKFIIDQIKREIKSLNGNIEGLMYDVSRNFDTIKKKRDKLKDKKSN
jgi:chromosome segregation ATPase